MREKYTQSLFIAITFSVACFAQTKSNTSEKEAIQTLQHYCAAVRSQDVDKAIAFPKTKVMKEPLQFQPLYIGIDVSKLTLDVSCLTPAGTHNYQQFENTKSALKSFGRWLLQQVCS